MKKNIGKLFLSMLKIGAFTFGGGYAMIALLQREFVEEKKWMTDEEFMDLIAIAESTPGPIAINSATYIGYKVGKIPGSILGTLGVVLPSFLIIYVISLFFDAFLSLTFVNYAFKGIQATVIYLILSAGIRMFRGLKKDWFSLCIFFATGISMILCSLFAVSFSTIFYILIAGTLGILLYFVTKKKTGKTAEEATKETAGKALAKTDAKTLGETKEETEGKS